jgi:hypothetical protein
MVLRIKEVVREALTECPEFASIKPGGAYYGEFGMPDIEARIERIIETLVDSIHVKLSPFTYGGRRIAGKVVVMGLPVDCASILGLSEAVLMTEKGEAFQWLYALLFQGNAIVVDWRYLSDVLSDEAKEKWSRTGEGFMVNNTSKHGWSVPPEIAGTEDDNLITRALTSPAIQQIIETELGRLLG